MTNNRDTTDEQLNAIIAPLLDPIADFKARTQVSYTVILPVIQKLSVELFVKARGLRSVRRLFEVMVQDFDTRGGVPTRSFLEVSKPPVSAAHLKDLDELLSAFVRWKVAEGLEPEHIGQALSLLVLTVAERAAMGDDWLIKTILAETLRDLRAQSEPQDEISKSEKFNVTEFVQHPVYGVGQILAIEEQEIAGETVELLVIKFEKNGTTVRTPSAKARDIGLVKSTPVKVDRGKLDTFASQGRASETVVASSWNERNETELVRRYPFQNFAGSGKDVSFDIVCRINSISKLVSIFFVGKPKKFGAVGWVVAMFAPADAPADYSFITMKVEPSSDGGDLFSVSSNDVDQCLKVLLLGREIVFRLIGNEGKHLATFYFENNRDFAVAYANLQKKIGAISF